MLKTSEFFGGTIAEAEVGSLILPRSDHDNPAVIGKFQDAPFIVFIAGPHQFRGFPSSGNTSYSGLIVPEVSYEVNEASIVDPNRFDIPLGALICRKGSFSICAVGERSFARSHFVELCSSRTEGTIEIAFTNWHVVLGVGSEKRTLFEVDLRR